MRIGLTHLDCTSAATRAARILIVIFILLTLLLGLLWPILVERPSDRLTAKLGVACSHMVAQIGQASARGGDFAYYWPAAYLECWSTAGVK
jgi:cyanate permease